MRTQVGIIGAGPAGLFLSRLLERAGIDCVVLEARSREYVEGRVRAGVLEQHTVDLMHTLGVGERLMHEGTPDPYLNIRFELGTIRIDLRGLTAGRAVTVYGQQEIVKDLIAARLSAGGAMVFGAEALAIDDIETRNPTIHYRRDDRQETLECDVVAGCDGFHGVARASMPGGGCTVLERRFPFGWLGILAESAPLENITYAHHERGFALFSRRSPTLQRLYLQCTPDEDLALWPPARIWEELHARLGNDTRDELSEGPILQQGVTAVRAFVATPMQHGRLFLAGDAVHILPPTGAKGLNLAVADVQVLARGLEELLDHGRDGLLRRYSEICLQRVWKTVRYSNYMTELLHRFPGHDAFARQIQRSELEHLAGSRAAQTVIAENYVGLPFVLPS